jgi:hypothetical protein
LYGKLVPGLTSVWLGIVKGYVGRGETDGEEKRDL